MTAENRITRASSAVGKGIRYGKGGYYPADPLPCRKPFALVWN